MKLWMHSGQLEFFQPSSSKDKAKLEFISFHNLQNLNVFQETLSNFNFFTLTLGFPNPSTRNWVCL